MGDEKIVVDTDLLLEHLVHSEGASYLRTAMNSFFCYTTVFNAIEAFSIARSEKEIQAVDDAMSSLKVLGLNAKSAKVIGNLFADSGSKRNRDLRVLIAGVCRESKLPILTLNPRRFSGIEHVRVIPARLMARTLPPVKFDMK